jgi:Mrp family chromosome partitioning ATPase/capsular polysaccharide biosynthesis protein
VDKPTTLSEYLAILRRRKWIVIVMVVFTALTAVVISALQSAQYQATTHVLINRANIVSSISGVTDPSTLGNDPTRFLATQSDVARSPTLARQIVSAAGVPGMTAGKLLASSSVNPATNADILDIAVTNRSPSAAVRLANTYAQQYTRFKTSLDTARINDALSKLQPKIEDMAKRGVPTNSPSYAALLEDQSRLETVGQLLANNTQVIRTADQAAKVRPRTKRNALLGVLFGLVLGVGLTFAADAFDRRLRTGKEAEAILGLPLLARLPRPPRKLEKANRLVTIADPTSIEAEAFRKLRTSIEFANFDRRSRTFAVASAAPQEGKSTTVANLAVTLARAGRRVALVDLDLRSPFLHKFFGLPTSPGVADVVGHNAGLSDALREIPLSRETSLVRHFSASASPDPSAAGTNGGSPRGELRVLPVGTAVADPGEFIGRDGIRGLLNELAEQFDYVLLDTPPFIAVGDAMTLSPYVDALVVVTRLRVVPRSLLEDLARQLDTSRADAIGFVLAGAELEDTYGEARYYYPFPSSRERAPEAAPHSATERQTESPPAQQS